MKVTIILLGITLAMPILGMKQNTSASVASVRLSKRDPLGRIPFHYVPLLPEQIPVLPKQDYNIQELDTIKCHLALFVVGQAGTSLDVKDNQGKTPYDYAEMNKDKLPKLYKVMQAIKLVDDIQKRLAPLDQFTDEYLAKKMLGDDKSNIELKDQLNAIPKLSSEEFLAWCNAKKTIDEYAEQVMPE